jgi:hypothetical protein
MAAQLAFTAIFSGDEAVLARAVAGLPGLAIDGHLGALATWTQANECARRLNEGLGLSASESRSIVTDAILTAQKADPGVPDTAAEVSPIAPRRRYKAGPG